MCPWNPHGNVKPTISIVKMVKPMKTGGLVKGSQAMKDRMKQIRALKKKK